MKNVVNYLDDLKGISGSDYKSAKLLEITKESVSIIRKRGQMSDKTAVKMADLLGIDRSEVLIAAAVARSEGAVKSAWGEVARKAGIAASFIGLCLIANQGIGDFDSQISGLAIIGNFTNNIHYAKSLLILAVGLILALVVTLLTRSHKNGKTKEKQLLPH